MMLNKVAEWRVSVLEKARKENYDVCFKITAVWSGQHKGFILVASLDGKGEIYVSSQRQDKRVFKTLDALRKATLDCGISWFEVVG